MVRESRKARQNLLKKGFAEFQGAKHIHYIFTYKGNEICKTRMSRNGQDIDDYLISKMSTQLYLDRKDFLGLIDCPLSEEDYIKILKDKNIL